MYVYVYCGELKLSTLLLGPRGWGEVKTDFKASAPWGSEISYCYYYCVMRTMMLFFLFLFLVNIKFTNTMLPFYNLSKAPGAGDLN